MDNINKKSKFSRQLRNRLNQSLTIINTLNLNTFEKTTNYSQLDTLDTLNISNSNSSCKSDTNFDKISYNDNNSNHDNDVFINLRNLNCSENVESVDISDTNYAITIENKEHVFCSKLQKWAINENVTHSTLNSLLNVLRAEPGYNYLPKDARTLLKTPINTHAKKLGSGLYYYFGINETLSNM